MTAWEQAWEAGYRRQRWIERDGHFYPRGTPLTLIVLDEARRHAVRVSASRRAGIARRARRAARVLLSLQLPPAPARALPGAA